MVRYIKSFFLLLQRVVLFGKKHQSWFMHAKLRFSGLCGGILFLDAQCKCMHIRIYVLLMTVL